MSQVTHQPPARPEQRRTRSARGAARHDHGWADRRSHRSHAIESVAPIFDASARSGGLKRLGAVDQGTRAPDRKAVSRWVAVLANAARTASPSLVFALRLWASV